MKAVGYPCLVRLLGLGSMLLLCVLLMAGVGGAQESTGTYTNPVSRDFADTFADPSIIKAKDGYWYAYGTSDPLREGENTSHTIPIARSKDLVDWNFVGDAFGASNRPSWAEPDAGIWAPDIRYLDGEYYMYYVVTETRVTPERGDNAIGVATAPTPTGPWKDSGAPVVGPRRGNGGFLWTFDPSEFTDTDGTRYLYYGSYNGGVYVTKLSPDGRERRGAYNWPVQQADIVGEGAANGASILLRDAPAGDYTVETKLTIDLGENMIHNYQQGGLIAYVDDDLWARLSHVAIWNTRQTEFGKEMPFADATSFGGMLVGPPDTTTWLRLSHRVDPKNGEHEFRAATSRDGENWIWGGTWTLPAGTMPRIGLISLGKQDPNDPPATARFDYFRVYRP